MRFLRYSQRSCTEVQSQLYVALDQSYITETEFQKIYHLASRVRSADGAFIRYLERDPRRGGGVSATGKGPEKKRYPEPGTGNREPGTKNQEPGTQ